MEFQKDREFLGKTAIFSGAASGMGLCFAKAWTELGGNAVMCDIDGDVLRAKLEEIDREHPGKAASVVTDVRDYDSVCHARDEAVRIFGGIDVLVNFAGGTAVRVLKVDRDRYPEFPDVPIEVYDWGLDVNLRGQLYFAHAAAKVMREERRGLIVNIGSISGMEGDGYGMDYPTAKSGAMFGLTKSLARFGAPYGIRAVCISPGPVLTRPAMANMKTLLGRAAEPREIVDLILFIASDQGQFINGENILIDGGRNAMGRA